MTFESFTPAALSCFGSAFNRTPAIDSIAAKGWVASRLVAENVDPRLVLRSWWSQPWWEGRDVTFITDDPMLADAPEVDPHAQVHWIENAATSIATTWEDTHLARLASLAAASLTQMDGADEASSSGVVWLHSRFLSQAWDAPRSLFPVEELAWEDESEALYDDEGKPIEAQHTDAWTAPLPALFNDVEPPHLNLGINEHPDFAITWMRTYATQVRLIDLVIETLTLASPSSRVLLAGTSGMALGTNRHIGPAAGPLRSCHLHLPLILALNLQQRSGHLLGSGQVATWLNALLSGQVPAAATAAAWAQPYDSAAPVITHDQHGVPVAVSTHDWFYGVNDNRLFVKPDDIHDVNDVARLRPDVVEQLLIQCDLNPGGVTES
ncbi:MAG: hypothetical protein AAGD07_08575 [Planctomycetota bacterium]